MKKRCGKTLTLSILMALLAGTVPVFAEDVTGQQVTIDQDQEGGLICGGYAMDGNALKNTLSILGSASITSKDINSSLNADNATVAGGYAENGNAISNTVNIRGTGNHEIGYIYGGFADSDSSTASGNQVTITGGTFQTHDIFGAADAITVNNNRISIGGDADITLTSTGPDGNGIYGGFTESDSSTARGNQVTFSGGTVRGAEFIAGAWADYTVDNQVTITDETLENDMLVAGGLGYKLAQGNAASVAGKANLTVLGLAGGLSTDDDRGDALGNQVAIGQDASVTAVAIGGGAGGSASQNLADIKGKVTGYLLGGGGVDGSSETAAVSGNVLNLENATLIPIQKEQAQSILKSTTGDDYENLINALKKPGETIQAAGGALLYGGKATDNMVNLSGTMDLSKVNLYGWITPQDILTDPSSMDMEDIVTDHRGNTLNVGYTSSLSKGNDGNPVITGKASNWKGSKVQGIYNFDKIAFYNIDHSQPALTVTDTVSLPDNVALDLDHFTPSSSPEDSVIQDDVLIDASGASTVKGLDKLYESGKDKYQQPVTRTYANGGVTVTGKDGLALSADNKLYYGLHSLDAITYKTIDWKTDGTVLTLADSQKFDLANTKVHTEDIGFTAKSLETITKAGNYAMTLLDTQGNKTLSAGNLTTKKGTWNVGNALEGTGEASLDANGNVVYKLDTVEKAQKPEVKVDAAEQTHNALIANEAALGTLAAGRDRMEGLLDTFNGQEGGVFTFASIGGSKDKYDTGSHSSTYTWNGLAGVGNDVALHNGDFSYGVFYEYGKGHYDVDGAGYTGSGDAHYSGAGLMAKYVARNKNYGEASLHFGQLKNNADSVLHSRSGSALGYETDSSYWSGHVGFGHIFDLTDQVASTSRGGIDRASRDLDVYGKYFYTHVGGDSFRAGNVDYWLDDLNSSLLRIGARLNNRSGRNNYYCGLAWDYEFDGESRGTVSAAGLSANIRKADIGGSSMMAEAGWKLEATKESPWDVNLSLQAYAGQHKGIGGNVFVGYHF
ncbi:autotransporter outer membrane beta-barrel domain-containing protein [uncultured Dialister sp.]|uniref:autotransporter outer membrane beta-barrel domain-containing protein n=1 Tax=uncultured Dialister sp. TaxID=278064 RepID=UPI00265E9004|nr:autotransporter outer membrane beta-barrel domain-containing protein [uncultured Dialister sp.]